jgi:hypothetical protein
MACASCVPAIGLCDSDVVLNRRTRTSLIISRCIDLRLSSVRIKMYSTLVVVGVRYIVPCKFG